MENKKCLSCHKIITEGRSDKKFCSIYCKSAYQYEQNKNIIPALFTQIDKQLKTNRKILKKYNKAGQSSIKKSTLLKEGFDPNFFTHYWKAKNNNVYLFCYEYGFRDLKPDDKYMLITWQKYMSFKK